MKHIAKYCCVLFWIINFVYSYKRSSNVYWIKPINLSASSTKLNCIVPNWHSDNVVWFKNNIKLDIDILYPRVTVEIKCMLDKKFSILVFHSLQQTDIGFYHCILSTTIQFIPPRNEHLHVNNRKSQTLQTMRRVKRFENKMSVLNDPPEKAANVKLLRKTSHNADFLVSISSDGNVPISSCTATLLKFSVTGYLPAAMFQQRFNNNVINISHLEPHSQYKVSVSCHNIHGSSPKSAPFTFKTLPEIPHSQPTITNFTRLNNSMILVHWALSSGVISYYKVLLSPTQPVSPIEVKASCCIAKVKVQDSVSYSIFVFSCNPSGCGPASKAEILVSAQLYTVIAPTAAASTHTNVIHPSNEIYFVIVISVVGVSLIVGVALYYVIKKRRRREENSTIQLENSVVGRNSTTLRSVNDYYTPMSPHGSILYAGNLREILGEVHIEKENLVIGKLLGEGEFGYVYKGKLTFSETDGNTEKVTDVAVKCIKTLYRTADETEALVNEGLRMKEFNHPNVMGLIGMCLSNFTHASEQPTNEPSPLVVLPYLPNGDLRNHLFLSRTSGTVNQFTLLKLIQFALDIARGMEYLANHKFVHRDLAARNCMLTKDFSVVVSDFGLSRKLYAKSYYRQAHITKLPVKWMAIESLGDNIFNSTTDIWSFGVTFWEILTFCQAPYPGVANHEVYNHLRSGMRLNKPAYCSQELWHTLVYPCWNPQAKERINFSEIVVRIERFLSNPDTDLSAPLSIPQCTDALSSGYEEPTSDFSNHYKLAEESPSENQNSPLLNCNLDKSSDTSSNIVTL